MPPLKKQTPFQLHKERWREGCGSDQCAAAKHIVFCRGKIPCDVLFIGEAPGESENVLGQPFIGPAGLLLDQVIGEACWDSGHWSEDSYARSMNCDYSTLRLCWTNLVGCIPRDDEESTKKAPEPSKAQIKACQPRLAEFVRLVKPKLVVYVGLLSEKHGPEAIKGLDVKTCKIIHPAAILRAGIDQKGLLYQRATVALATALESLSAPE